MIWLKLISKSIIMLYGTIRNSFISAASSVMVVYCSVEVPKMMQLLW